MALSNCPFLKHVVNLRRYFSAKCKRVPVLGTHYWCRIGYHNLAFDHVRGPKIVRLLIVKYVRIFLQHGFYDIPPNNFLYRASFLAFLWGLLGDFVSSGFSVFIWSISVSVTSSARPRTVGLGEVSFSCLKLASNTYTLLADASVFACLGGDVNCVGLRSIVPTLVSPRAEITPWMGIVAGSMHSKGRKFFRFFQVQLGRNHVSSFRADGYVLRYLDQPRFTILCGLV